MPKPYRKNVGMVVFNSKGEVLAGERYQFQNSWQFPQGGIDEDEEPINAALRELYEEVGIEKGEIVFEYPEWISYDFPKELNLHKSLKKFKGQTQKWFLIFWDGKVSDCKLDLHEKEFERVQFMTFRECLEKIVHFKKPIYEKLKGKFQPEIDKYIKRNL